MKGKILIEPRGVYHPQWRCADCGVVGPVVVNREVEPIVEEPGRPLLRVVVRLETRAEALGCVDQIACLRRRRRRREALELAA